MKATNIPTKDEFILKAELNGIDFSKNVYDLTMVERNTMDILAILMTIEIKIKNR